MTQAEPVRMSVGVLALQGDFREHREMLDRMGHYAYEIRKPEQLRDLDALIIPGGESTTIARLIISNNFQEPLREFCASGRPVWGTCAGAILLAKHVDRLDRPGIETMDISVVRNAFGRQVDSFEADLEIKGVEGGPFHAVFIRAPLIDAVHHPAGAIARLEDGTVVAARQDNLLATSFHPELDDDTRLHEYFLSIGRGIQPQPRTLPEGLSHAMAPFVDETGRLTAWPVKERIQREAIAWLAHRFEHGRHYTEAEVNRVLDAAHSFHDAALLRRLLYEWGYLDRERDGSRYWLAGPHVAEDTHAS
ncbi:MAG: pyridoxal 5'-phosphate synthase glutaminase subunit PdxT [Dehalococcoidia bacterium]|nr:pyridoxal 5'-phosphate synthase glutaminase subunit PdxT [Dehalococcoidia bacterium]